MAMNNRMPPPGGERKPGLMVAIGIGKPKPGMKGAPEDDKSKDPMDAADPDNDGDDDSGKLSPDKAMVSHADENCANCSNYHAEDGSCEKVDGQFDPMDRCFVFFEGMSDDEGDTDNDSGSMDMSNGPMGQNLGQSS